MGTCPVEVMKRNQIILFACILLAIVGVLQTADWATIVSPQRVGPTILGIAILVAVLRSVTDGPVGRGGGSATKGGGGAS